MKLMPKDPLTKTGADILIETLISWNVEVIFGLPGDGINGIMEALRKNQDKIKFIQVRHEESASLMAVGYYKYTKKLGVCLATSGPGALHLLNGLYDAKLDQAAVLAITGHHFHDLINTFAQQDVPLERVFDNVSVYNTTIMGPAHVRASTDLAVRHALSKRGVAHICIPVDFQYMELALDHPSLRNKPNHTNEIFTSNKGIPKDSDIKLATDILNKSENITILAGQGALNASKELSEMSNKLKAPIIKALLGKALLEDNHPNLAGHIGLLGSSSSIYAMENCDTLLIIGSTFPYIEFYPDIKREVKVIQIDIDSSRIGLRYPVNVGLVGDSQKTLIELLEKIKDHKNDKFLKNTREKKKEWDKIMMERQTRMDKPLKPQVVAYNLGEILDDDAIVSCDTGTITVWWARHLRVKKNQMHAVSGLLATMACGLNYGMAAKVAYPKRQSVVIAGDGGFSMLMAEFANCVKYNLDVKVVVFKNNVLGKIKWEQMVFLGNPEYGVELQPIDFVKFAESCGGKGFRIDDPKTCKNIMVEALNTPGPVIIEAIIDPYEPPLPARISYDQAKKFMESILRGEPNSFDIIKTVVKDKIREII